MVKHLSGLGDNWHLYLGPAMLIYNTYNTPNLDNLIPFVLTYGRKPKFVLRLESTPPYPSNRNICKSKASSRTEIEVS